jgi:hypothetical protein
MTATRAGEGIAAARTLAIYGSVLLLAVIGCSPANTDPPRPAVGAGARPFVAPVSYNSEDGPPVAEIGVSYPFALYVHCDAEMVVFAGRPWRKVAAHTPLPTPAPGGAYVPYGNLSSSLFGTMTLSERDLLRFTFADPTGPAATSIDYVPLTGELELCA